MKQDVLLLFYYYLKKRKKIKMKKNKENKSLFHTNNNILDLHCQDASFYIFNVVLVLV